MKTSGHFYYAVCKIYRFGYEGDRVDYLQPEQALRHTIGFCFFRKNAEHRPGSMAPPVKRVQTCNVVIWTEGTFRVHREGGLRTWQGLIWWKGRWCGRCAILETSGNALKADEWKQAEHIQWALPAPGPGTFYSTGHGRFRTGSQFFSLVAAGPAFWMPKSVPIMQWTAHCDQPAPPVPPHSSDSLSPAKVCDTHRLTPSCAVLIFWTTAQGSRCWLVWLEDTASSKPEVG